MKLIIISFFFLTGIINKSFAQTDTVLIHTSAVCDMCKKAIEKNMSFEKGVKKSNLDLESKTIQIVYNPEKTNPEKLKLAISKAGYDADSIKADPKAFKRLPECCQSPMHD